MILNNATHPLAIATRVVTSVARHTLPLAEVLKQLEGDNNVVSTTPTANAPLTVEVMTIVQTDRTWEVFLDAVPLRDKRAGFPDHLWVGWDVQTKDGQTERTMRYRVVPQNLDLVMRTMKDMAFPQQLFHVTGWKQDGTRVTGCFYSTRWPVPPALKREGDGFADLVFPGEPKRGTWTPPETQEFHSVAALEPGDVLSWRFPFLSATSFKNGERVVVSGDFDIPTTRPNNEATWELFPRAQPLRKGITGPQWPRMIDAIQGQFPEAISPLRDGEAFVKAVKERMRKLNRPAKAVNATRSTGVFQGYPGNKIEFSVGSRVRLLWELARPGTTPVFVVDSTDTLACYVFEVEQDARDWASGAVDYTVARKRAHQFVVHQHDWEARVDAILAALGVVK